MAINECWSRWASVSHWAWYTIRGSLPSWLIGISGNKITDDEDPRNLSPKLYVPVLLAVIVLAALLYHYAAGGRR